jgi:hypothetical protein
MYRARAKGITVTARPELRGIIDTVDAVAFSHLARALDPGVTPE